MVLDNILLKKIEEVKQFIANMIPIAGNQAPSADTTNGSSGTNMDYAKSDHTHPKSTLYAEADHTHSQYLTTHQDISGKLNISQTGYKGKNVVVDNTTGNITFEDKPTVPQASTSSPLADMTGGAIGSDSKYAKADHQHPLSSAYATSGHTHTTSDLPSTVISETDIGDIIDTLNTNDIFAYSNKNVGQSGDTICLVGKLYGDDIEGKTIQFYNNNTLLGSSNTDVYGTALYDYVCTGDGEKEITTKYGTLQSEPYPVLDTLFYDKALSGTGNHNDNWLNTYSASVTRGDDGTTISKESYAAYFADNPSISAEYDWTAPFAVEVFIVSTNGQANNMQIYDLVNNSNGTLFFSGLNITGNNTLKVVCNGSTIKVYVDGVEKPNAQVTATFDKCRCGLVLGTGGTIKYKDFKIYPI